MALSKPTLGQKALELLDKAEDHYACDIQSATEKDYLKTLDNIIEKHKDYADLYYIQVMTLQENFHRRHLPNIYKFMFIVRKSRPEPAHDMTLYSYNNKENKLVYHWSIPDASTCDYLIENEKELPSSEKQLLKFAKQFCAGSLR